MNLDVRMKIPILLYTYIYTNLHVYIYTNLAAYIINLVHIRILMYINYVKVDVYTCITVLSCKFMILLFCPFLTSIVKPG